MGERDRDIKSVGGLMYSTHGLWGAARLAGGPALAACPVGTGVLPRTARQSRPGHLASSGPHRLPWGTRRPPGGRAAPHALASYGWLALGGVPAEAEAVCIIAPSTSCMRFNSRRTVPGHQRHANVRACQARPIAWWPVQSGHRQRATLRLRACPIGDSQCNTIGKMVRPSRRKHKPRQTASVLGSLSRKQPNNTRSRNMDNGRMACAVALTCTCQRRDSCRDPAPTPGSR
jgi:hypothetical protein